MSETPLTPIGVLDLEDLTTPESTDQLVGWDTSAAKMKRVSVSALAGSALRIITPSALSADVNDWAPTGILTADIIRASAGAFWAIGGLTSGVNGRRITIANVGTTHSIALNNEDPSSTAANRFSLPDTSCPVILRPRDSVTLVYDGTLARYIPAFSTPALATRGVCLTLPWDEVFVTHSVVLSGGTATVVTGGGALKGITLSTGSGGTGACGVGNGPVTFGSASSGSDSFGDNEEPMLLMGTFHCPADTLTDFVLRIGFVDSVSAEPTDGMYLRYQSTASTKWEAKVITATTASAYDTGVTYVASDTIRFAILKRGANLVSFYLGTTGLGTFNSPPRVATAVANVPGTSEKWGVGGSVVKTTGAVVRVLTLHPFTLVGLTST